jgi:hypothetical protein
MIVVSIALVVLVVLVIYYTIANVLHRDKGNTPDDAS